MLELGGEILEVLTALTFQGHISSSVSFSVSMAPTPAFLLPVL
jgi:hypothetical protein